MAMVHLAEGPTLREADLACPACGAAFRVREGIAWFHAPSPPPADAERATSAADAPHDPDVAADRLAALLGVADGPWPVLLAGERATLGAALAARVSPPQWWLNPPTPAPPRPAEATLLAATLHTGPRWPLARQVVAAVALDALHATADQLAEAARVLRPGGRLVAPAWAPLPAGVRELARDESEWVAEGGGPAGGLVALRRRGG